MQRESFSTLRRRFARDGFAIVDTTGLDTRAIDDAAWSAQPPRRMLDAPWCRALAQALARVPAIAAVLPAGAVAVQCTRFEKSTARNWLVPRHQDLIIPVHERIDQRDLHGWSTKNGVTHVQAPANLLRRLVAVRLHLDACGIEDGALHVVPGSHLRGIVGDEDAALPRALEVACPVPQGHAMIMRPLLLHRSGKASGSSRRRVLHIVFGPEHLPLRLRWPASSLRVRPCRPSGTCAADDARAV